MYGDGLTILIIALVVGVIVFIVTRELWMWYWKINKIVSLLESIDNKLDGSGTSTRVLAAGTAKNAGFTEESEEDVSGRPNAPKEMLDRYRGMEDSSLETRFRTRGQYSAVEVAVIEWEYKRRNLG